VLLTDFLLPLFHITVHIPSGALPKSLHTLDLSRNKIVAIEGLRELTRLRVLNLSYNRISRIGQGNPSVYNISFYYYIVIVGFINILEKCV
jgi:Leucine-rich repeat (LRR) protein